MKKHYLLIGSLLLSSLSFGAGFQLNLQGLRQLAMGGAGTAVPWDASTIFYNPGGLTSLRNVQAYGSVNFLSVNTRWTQAPTGTMSADVASKIYTPFNLYVGGPLAYKSRFSIGLGVYTPFGTGIKWDDNWTGRYIAQDIQMQTIFFQPTLAYKIDDNISVGAGFVYGIGSVTFKRAIPLLNSQGEDGQSKLTGNGHGFGFNLGIHIKPTDNLQFGITYRSQVNMKVKRGYAEFTVPSALSSSFQNTAFTSTLPLPQTVSVGAGWNINKDLTLVLDASFVGWAAYDTLTFDFENNTDALQDSHSPRRYRNTVILRAGAHYKFSDRVAGMIGTAYDQTPIKDGFLGPDLPDNDRFMATGGLSIKFLKNFTAVGMVEYAFIGVRNAHNAEANFYGKYQTKVINPGLAITYDFK